MADRNIHTADMLQNALIELGFVDRTPLVNPYKPEMQIAVAVPKKTADMVISLNPSESDETHPLKMTVIKTRKNKGKPFTFHLSGK